MNNIFHRISVRKYQDRPVEKEKITAILKAAMQAPSATNQQPWEFFVVTDRAMLEELSKACPYGKMTATAPVAIVAAYRTGCRLPEYAHIDLSIAMENLWLETDAQGLGGVWIGTAPNENRMKAVEQAIDMPSGLRSRCLLSRESRWGAFADHPSGRPSDHPKQFDALCPPLRKRLWLQSRRRASF